MFHWIAQPGAGKLLPAPRGRCCHGIEDKMADLLDGFPELLWHIPGQGKGAIGTRKQCVINTAHVTGSVLPQGLL